jgi:hypothetical protein
MKDNEIRDFIDALTNVAKTYYGTQQLREQIKGVVFPIIEKHGLKLDMIQILDELDDGIEDLELEGLHHNTGYRKLKSLYSNINPVFNQLRLDRKIPLKSGD